MKHWLALAALVCFGSPSHALSVKTGGTFAAVSGLNSVGVSTTAPVWPLTLYYTSNRGISAEQVDGTEANTGMLWTTGAATNRFSVRASSNSAGNAGSTSLITSEANGNVPSAQFQTKASSGTWDNRTLIASADRAFGAYSMAAWTSGTTYSILNRIIAATEGIPGSASNMPTYIRFDTTSTGTVSGVEKVRIESNGGLRPYVRTRAQIDGMTPNQLGSIIICSDCTLVYDICTSTGLVLSGYRSSVTTRGCGTNN